MIYYDGTEWRDPEELLESAGRHSQEEYDKVAAMLAEQGMLS